MNGLAKVKNRAIPTPIMVTASSRPATMNIFTCSIGTISGWRAAPSRNLPPSRPKPMAVPRAPRPISRATAIAVSPTTVSIFPPDFLSCWLKVEANRLMVVFVRHRQVDDGQHHEDEGLQGDDQDVEHSPRPVQGYAQGTQQEHSATEHDGDQNEDQFA